MKMQLDMTGQRFRLMTGQRFRLLAAGFAEGGTRRRKKHAPWGSHRVALEPKIQKRSEKNISSGMHVPSLCPKAHGLP